MKGTLVEGTLVAALAASLASMAAFALLAVMFRRGSWLFLLAGRAAREGADEQGVRALGKRMAVVLVVGSAFMATLAAYLGAEIARDAAVASVAAMANNAAFLALIASLIWFFVVQRPARPSGGDAPAGRMAARVRAASLAHLHLATILFVIALIGVIAAVGVLAAL